MLLALICSLLANACLLIGFGLLPPQHWNYTAHWIGDDPSNYCDTCGAPKNSRNEGDELTWN